MGIFERIRSAVDGAIPVEDDLDMGDSARMKNLPEPEDENDAISEAGAPVQSVNGETGEVEVDSGVSDHDDLDNVTSNQHHDRYDDSEASAAVEGDISTDSGSYDAEFTGSGSTVTTIDTNLSTVIGASAMINTDDRDAAGSAGVVGFDGSSIDIRHSADQDGTVYWSAAGL